MRLPLSVLLLLFIVGCSNEPAGPVVKTPTPPPLPPMPPGMTAQFAPAPSRPKTPTLRLVEPILAQTNATHASIYSTLPRSRWNNGSVLSPAAQQASMGCCLTNSLTNAVVYHYEHWTVTNGLELNITNWAGSPAVGFIKLTIPTVTGKTYSVQTTPQPGWQWLEIYTFTASSFPPVTVYSDWMYSADSESVGYWRVMSN